MKINSFKAEGVHDYLNFDIQFFSELTFLIGINGSGKTSALKLILGLTSPSYNYLNQITYKFCEVICSSNMEEKDIKIRAEQGKNGESFKIEFTYNNETIVSDPLPRFLRNDEPFDIEEFSITEQRHREYFDNLEITKKIREIATPKFLGLDRRIYEGRYIDFRFKNRRHGIHQRIKRNQEGYPEPPAIDSSLEEVQTLVYDYFRKIAQRQPQISEEFKKKIFKQSFSFISDYNLEPIPSSIEVLQERKEKVTAAVSNLGIDYLNYDVNSFFSKIENIVKQNIEYELKSKKENKDKFEEEYFKIIRTWFNNGSQLKRIDDLINYSQQYQEQIGQLRTPIKKLEDIATNFLKEGNKSLIIAPDGEIKVRLKNNKLANVFELSSGEKQIIIMIAHLIFEEDQKPSGIFIIDEPELSLHIAWQEIFVDSIMEASPKTQFILATHSPSIISKVKREQLCQDLNKLNKK
jgi:predicted ATP-binding protein involved in virulence